MLRRSVTGHFRLRGQGRPLQGRDTPARPRAGEGHSKRRGRPVLGQGSEVRLRLAWSASSNGPKPEHRERRWYWMGSARTAGCYKPGNGFWIVLCAGSESTRADHVSPRVTPAASNRAGRGWPSLPPPGRALAPPPAPAQALGQNSKPPGTRGLASEGVCAHREAQAWPAPCLASSHRGRSARSPTVELPLQGGWGR